MKENDSANYYTEININDSSSEEFRALAVQTAEYLGWIVESVSDKKIVINIMSSMVSNGEIFTIRFTADKALLESHSVGNLKFDFAKNKKNIRKFIEAYNEVSGKLDEEDVVELENAVRDAVAQQSTVRPEEIPDKNKKGLGDYLDFLKPRGDYFFTPLIVILNLIVFVLMLLNGANIFTPDSEILLKWGANFRPMTMDGEWWRMISSSFLHIGLLHLMLNMVALLYIGNILEPIIGRYKFIFSYFLTGMFASLFSLIWNANTISAGASGSIFGIIGVFTALLTTTIFGIGVRKSVLPNMLFYIILNIALGFKGDIDLAAHMGGLLSGFVVGYIYYFILSKKINQKTGNSLLVLLSILFIVATYYSFLSLPDDINKYQKLYQEFSKNEDKAIAIYKRMKEADRQEIYKVYSDTIVPLWRRNKGICENMQMLELPVQIKKMTLLYLQYSELRLEFSTLLLKNIESYDSMNTKRLNAINTSLDSIVKKINQE